MEAQLIALRKLAVMQLKQGKTVSEVATNLGRHKNWVYKWHKRFEEEGYNDPQKPDHMLRRNICAKMGMWRQYEQQETGRKKCGIQVPSSTGGSQGAENIE